MPASSPDTVYTWDEISKHKTADDLWFVIADKVYNVSGWTEHPGNNEVLVENGGKDATHPFEDQGHSDDARDMMKQFLIGKVDPASKPTKSNDSKTTAAKSATATPAKKDSPKTGGNMTGIICAVLILLLAAGGYYYLQIAK